MPRLNEPQRHDHPMRAKIAAAVKRAVAKRRRGVEPTLPGGPSPQIERWIDDALREVNHGEEHV